MIHGVTTSSGAFSIPGPKKCRPQNSAMCSTSGADAGMSPLPYRLSYRSAYCRAITYPSSDDPHGLSTHSSAVSTTSSSMLWMMRTVTQRRCSNVVLLVLKFLQKFVEPSFPLASAVLQIA